MLEDPNKVILTKYAFIISSNILKYIYIYTYQISKTGKEDQSKHTPGKRNKDPYINQSDQTRVIYTGNMSEFKSHWVHH